MYPDHFRFNSTDDFILDEDFREIVRESGSNDRLKELLECFPEKQQEIDLAVKVIRGLHARKFQQSDKKKHELWQQIMHHQKRQTRRLFFRVAASLVLLIGFGSSVFYFTNTKQVEKNIVASVPQSNNATLILADGKKVSITSKQSTIRYSANGSGIMVNDTSAIEQPVSAEGLNEMIIPYGKHSYIMLSDGTGVWLNSGSRLVFPPVFRGNTREVFLEGEALFEVAKNREKPFYVKTDLFKMKVYGTKFNVQAYVHDNNYSIVLVEGKVSMNVNNGLPSEEIFLAPNQKATISKDKEKFEISFVENPDFDTAWVAGYLTFKNEEVPDLLKRVSRYYNVTIETNLPDNIEKIYGKLDLKDNLERVLDGIAFISKTKYEKVGDKYVFMKCP